MMLDQFMNEFIGYGDLSSNLWLLGPEEAGCQSVEDLQKRVLAWAQLGAEPVIDLFDFHQLIGATHLFGEKPKIQRTWRRLIQMLLVSRGEAVSRESVAAFQAKRLGRKDSGTLLGELLPLPKPAMKSWPYAALAGDLPFLADRQAYRTAMESVRIELLSNAIQSCRPSAVVFYGTTYRQSWGQIAGVEFRLDEDGYGYAEANGQKFLLVQHPNARGVGANYFIEAATRFLRN